MLWANSTAQRELVDVSDPVERTAVAAVRCGTYETCLQDVPRTKASGEMQGQARFDALGHVCRGREKVTTECAPAGACVRTTLFERTNGLWVKGITLSCCWFLGVQLNTGLVLRVGVLKGVAEYRRLPPGSPASLVSLGITGSCRLVYGRCAVWGE